MAAKCVAVSPVGIASNYYKDRAVLKSASIDQVLNKLCYACSHSLRGPMVSLEGLVHLLKCDAKVRSTYPKLMQNALEEMKALTAEFSEYGSSLDQHELPEHKKIAAFEINSLLKHFVFICAHGLTEPIESVKQQIQVASQKSDCPTERKYLALADASVKRIECFVEDVEIYAMNRRDRLFKEEVDLDSLLQTVLKGMPFSCLPHIIFSFDQQVPLTFDKLRLKIILQKLIFNAICFHNKRDTPRIEVTLKVDAIGLLVRVKDNGMGIEKKYVDRIFDLFWRASNASPGSGLGLYLTSQIVSRMNGRISVDSQVGSGSEFTVELPNYYSLESMKGLTKSGIKPGSYPFGDGAGPALPIDEPHLKVN